MKRFLSNTSLLFLLGVFITSISLYSDWGSDSFCWFQRSGSLLVMIGAILSFRSIVRLGKKGAGGAPSRGATIAKIKGSFLKDGRRMVQIEQNPDDLEYDNQVGLDKLAGYIGAIYAILGTIIWGYGDLLGKIL